MIAHQRHDLERFGVHFDTWFSEQTLHDAGKVVEVLDRLIAEGVADEQPYQLSVEFAKDGSIKSVAREEQPVEDDEEVSGEAQSPTGATLWLRSTKFGDDKDRVLRRKDGRLTYISSDVAYHADKFNRPPNADKLITVLGPDHHGYIGRLTAVVAAFLETQGVHAETSDRPLTDEEAKVFASPVERDKCRSALELARQRLNVVIYQIVRFVKDGKPTPMRKRDGNIYELKDLIEELGKAAAPEETLEERDRIGKDVARFFYLMRSFETHMDFDIDLATKQSDENPVFYAQYAHARICSVLRKAGPQEGRADESLLIHPTETALIKKVLDLPWEVSRAAADCGVHRLTTYAVDLARAYHHFYDACRVVDPAKADLTRARVDLCHTARVALKGTFDILGVSAPERMDRTVEPANETTA
jgi:arginyl-tRNA synthetase